MTSLHLSMPADPQEGHHVATKAKSSTNRLRQRFRLGNVGRCNASNPSFTRAGQSLKRTDVACGSEAETGTSTQSCTQFDCVEPTVVPCASLVEHSDLNTATEQKVAPRINADSKYVWLTE